MFCIHLTSLLSMVCIAVLTQGAMITAKRLVVLRDVRCKEDGPSGFQRLRPNAALEVQPTGE